MDLKDYYYDLPEEYIAQTPLEKRDSSKLLMLNKETGEVKHEVFYNIINYLNKGDCLVLNDSRVLPARLLGVREDTGSPMEFLLLSRKDKDIWEVIVRPGKRAKPGRHFVFGNELKAEVLDIVEEGNRLETREMSLQMNVLVSSLRRMVSLQMAFTEMRNTDLKSR